MALLSFRAFGSTGSLYSPVAPVGVPVGRSWGFDWLTTLVRAHLRLTVATPVVLAIFARRCKPTRLPRRVRAFHRGRPRREESLNRGGDLRPHNQLNHAAIRF